MQRKRWLTLTVALACLALAACSGGPSSTGGGGGGDSNTIRLASVASDRPAVEEVVKLFKEQNPEVTVNTTFADVDQYQATLRTQLSSGTAPDVFFAWPGNGNPGAIEVLAPTGFLLDLSDRPWVSQIPEAIKPVTQVDGKTYNLPVAFTGIGAIYNKNALEDVGVQPPTTWSELLAFCDAAKAKGKVAFALGAQTPWVTQLVDYALVATLVYGPQRDFDAKMQAGSATFVGSPWETAMNKYLEMNERGCFSRNPLGTTYENSISQVATGKAVAVIQVMSAYGQARTQAPKVTEFGLFAVPATENADQTLMPGAAGGSYGVNAKAKNKDLSVKFIDFLATPEAMNRYTTALGNIPSIPNDEFKVDPALKTLVDFQKAGKTVPFMDQLWPNPKVQNTHFTGVQELFSGDAKPADVLAKMDEAYKQGA